MTRLNPHRVQPSTARVWRLYRVWRADGVLLYIGQTGREPLARLIEHLYEQQWAHEIARWEVDPQPYHSEADVDAAELAAIRAEKPIRNWVGNEGPHRQWQPKVGSYRHPGRRASAPRPTTRRVLSSPWTWWLAAWTVFTVALTVVDVVGQHLTARQSAAVVTVGMAGGWLWWRFYARRRVRRWVRRLLPRRSGR